MRVGFSPSSNHLAQDRILAPSTSLKTRDKREHSRSQISEDLDSLLRAKLFFARIKCLVKEVRKQFEDLRLREQYF